MISYLLEGIFHPGLINIPKKDIFVVLVIMLNAILIDY